MIDCKVRYSQQAVHVVANRRITRAADALNDLMIADCNENRRRTKTSGSCRFSRSDPGPHASLTAATLSPSVLSKTVNSGQRAPRIVALLAICWFLARRASTDC